jgi:hypothetical protein
MVYALTFAMMPETIGSSAGKDGDGDAHLAHLIAKFSALCQRSEALNDRCDALKAQDQAAGRVESPRLQAMYDRVEAIHRTESLTANEILNLPAASSVGSHISLFYGAERPRSVSGVILNTPMKHSLTRHTGTCFG